MLKETEGDLTRAGLDFAVPHASRSIAAAELGYGISFGAMARYGEWNAGRSTAQTSIFSSTLRRYAQECARAATAGGRSEDVGAGLSRDVRFPRCTASTSRLVRWRWPFSVGAQPQHLLLIEATELTPYVDVRILGAGARLILASEREAAKTAFFLLKSAAEFDV